MAAMTTACGDGNGGGNGNDESDAPRALRALTFNTALAPGFEPLAAERGPAVQAALATVAEELDLLCVQEYWDARDFDALAGATAGALPHVLRQAPKPGSGECSPEELGELGGCLAAGCGEASEVELVECAQESCSEAIGAVRGGCLGCMLEHLDGSFEQCVGDGSSADEPAIFRGAFDIGLLSRYPLLEEGALEYDAYFVRASALYARIEVPGLGQVDSFCTHLGSSLGVIPYQGPHESWEGEHAYQVGQLLDFIAEKADGSRPVLLLGDLNTGPAVLGEPPIHAELPADYQRLISSGLSSAFVEPSCTLCSDNSYRVPESHDLLLDHALVRGFEGATLGVERALTDRRPWPISPT